MSATTIGDLSVILRGDPRPLEQAISRGGLAMAALGGIASRVGGKLSGIFDDVQGDPIENEFRIINGPFQIQPDGSIDLGPIYGNVVLAGLTFDQARHAIIKHLKVNVGLGIFGSSPNRTVARRLR